MSRELEAGFAAWLVSNHGLQASGFSIQDPLAKVGKGAWRMPWLTEAMKDVISCDKRGVGANDH